MFAKPSLVTRITVGKSIGFAFGLAGFLILPAIVPEVGLMQRWGDNDLGAMVLHCVASPLHYGV